MNRPIINFSWNWNGKLFCKCFTTIRIRNDYKYQVGNEFDIQLHGKDLGPGVIRSITHFTLDKLTANMSYLDTGYSINKCKQTILTMYKNKNLDWNSQQFSFILIEQVEKVLLPFPDCLHYPYEKAG